MNFYGISADPATHIGCCSSSSGRRKKSHTQVQRVPKTLSYQLPGQGDRSPTDHVVKSPAPSFALPLSPSPYKPHYGTFSLFSSLLHFFSPERPCPQLFSWIPETQQLLRDASCISSRPIELLPTTAIQGPASTFTFRAFSRPSSLEPLIVLTVIDLQ